MIFSKRSWFFFIILLVILNKPLSAQDKPSSIRLNFFLNVGFPGYHQLGNDDIKQLSDEGMGTVQQGSVLIFYGNTGFGISFLDKFTISCLTGYSLGNVKWENAFGSGDDIDMSYHIWDLDFELKYFWEVPIPKNSDVSETYIFPLIGTGPTLKYRIIDENEDGFINGGGSWHYRFGVGIGLTSLAKSIGINSLEFSLIALTRPSYAFKEFKIGEAIPINYEGNSYSVFLQTSFIF